MSVSSALRSFRKKFVSGYAVSLPVRNAVSGAVSDIDQLLDIINSPSSSSSEKITSAGLVRSSIENQALSSVQEVWYSSRSLLDLDNQAEVRQAGWRLTISCIEHDDINVGAFNGYYHTIIDFSNIEDFHLVLSALNSLTQSGRRIVSGQVLVYQIPVVLVSWLQLLAVRAQELRSNAQAKDVSEPWGVTTPENFHELLRFCINTLKFNMSIYEDGDIEKLLLVITAIIRNTSSVADIKLCCEIIDSVLAFGIIPLSTLPQVLQVLCGITLIDESLDETAWRTIKNLAKSHLGNSTIMGLCQIMEPNENADVTTGMRLAAVRVLARLLKLLAERGASKGSGDSSSLQSDFPSTLEPEDGEVIMPVEQVMTAYANTLNFPSINLAVEVSNALYTLLMDRNTFPLFDHDIWQAQIASPLNLVCMLASWVDSSRGLRPPQNRVAPGSPLDEDAPASPDLTNNITKILALVIKATQEKTNNVPVEESLFVATELSDFLDEETGLIVVESFGALHYCSPYMTGWEDKLDLLLTKFYMRDSCPSSVRIKILSLCREIYLLVIGTDAEYRLTSITRKLFSVLSVADRATVDALLVLYEFMTSSGSWEVFEQTTNLLVSVFPDQSVKRTLKPEQSARNAKVAKFMVQLFLDLFQSSGKYSRFLYYSLVQICKSSIYDEEPFRETFALLCRLRVNDERFVMVSEPSLERDYGKIYEFQVGLSYAEKVLNKPSLVLKRAASLYEAEESADMQPIDESQWTIDPSLILSIVINILNNGGPEGVFSMVVINLPTQLSNIQFYNGCEGELVSLRNLMYGQIGSSKLPIEVKQEGISRHDILGVEIHVLTILVGYSRIFQKPDHDKLVQTLVQSMNQWDKTANWALHCLVVCCYECPSSVQRFLPQILSKLQTKISNTESSTHILEFLLTLCLVGSVTDNFNMQEFKRVFGICFSYIQHARDILVKSKAETDVNNSILSQYLLRLAYTSINYLFLAINISNRAEIVPYLIRSLILTNGNDESIDSMSITSYDFICRFAYSDQPLVLSSKAIELSRNPTVDDIDTRRWLVGRSIFEISTDRISGDGTLIYRRPTGTFVQFFQPALLGNPEAHTNLSLGEVIQNFNFSSNFWLLQMHGLQIEKLNVSAIPNDSQTNRAIATLDRAPVVDFHKVGIVYIGPGQSSEQEILSNASGSKPYRDFLKGIGRLVRLKRNREIYAGGLDTEMDLDGQFTYGWRGKIGQIIFHVTTMMPTQEGDSEQTSKKRHIGNNFVNIYWDESGREFVFDTVKSQFNFINIVITPTFHPGKYRVRAYRKEGLANVLAAYERKVVSEEQISLFVRHLAFKASQYASVYNQHGEYTDNWLYRLDLIDKLKERLASQRTERVEESEEEPLAFAQQLDFTAMVDE